VGVGFVGRRLAPAAILLVLGYAGLQQADAVSETRTLSLHHVHTGEDLTVTYKRNGRYDQAALQKLDWFLRDWRRNEQTRMDPQLFDLLWEVHREVGAKEAIHVISGYRAPETNAMLRARSNGVAFYSQHISGSAIDFFIPGVPLETQRIAALRLQGGGVGYYPNPASRFIHVDTGNVRHWPRMTRDQLLRVFPNGHTAHLPADGQPLPGHALALADLARGKRPAAAPRPSLVAQRASTPSAPRSEPRTAPPSRTAVASLVPQLIEAQDLPAVADSPLITAGIGARSTAPANDRVPLELALAYAAQAAPMPRQFPEVSAARAALAAPLPKANARPAAAQPAAATTRSAAGRHLDHAWLRAVVLTPSLHRFMTTTSFTAPDSRELRPFLHKPASTIMMTFSDDPYDGMTAHAFSGSAVVFLATVSFRTRTAALQ